MHRALIVSAADTNYRLPDITGYAAQVEVRSPFLDHRVVEFAARLPHAWKVARYGGVLRPKYLPRKVYENLIGPEIAWAPKKGMAANLRWDLELVQILALWMPFRQRTKRSMGMGSMAIRSEKPTRNTPMMLRIALPLPLPEP